MIREEGWWLLIRQNFKWFERILLIVLRQEFTLEIGDLVSFCSVGIVTIYDLPLSFSILSIHIRNLGARISGCNIVRNGFGSKRLRSGEIDNIQNHFFDHARLGQPIRREQFDVVPSGHSGTLIAVLV